jgi:hypothetical protein
MDEKTLKLKEMFVLSKDDAKEEGLSPNLPYQFAAETVKSARRDNKRVKDLNCFCFIVNIIMPLGGSQSALFRYPKPGEKVLIGVEVDDGAYLMGYLPENTADNIYTKNNNMVLPDEMAGQFFRYKGPNDTADEKEYSEIGFYNEKTLWNSDGSPDISRNQFVDTIKMVSTGDIHQKAKNHHQTKAKRFEILANCEGSRKTDKGSDKEFAFGDKMGDDPELYAGDAHTRAKNRIIIKAGKEIVLKVGRSSILITDKGIRIISKKTRSNNESQWDTSITLEPRQMGIVMTGKRIIGRAGWGFELSDMYGGSVNSQLGVVRVSGLDVRLATIGRWNYITRTKLNGLDFLKNAIFMGLDTGNVDLGDWSFLSSSISTALRVSGGALGGLVCGSGGLKEYDINDKAGVMMTAFDIIMLLAFFAGYVLEHTLFT